VQQDGHLLAAVAAQNGLDERLQHSCGIMATSHALFVVADPHEPRVLDRIEWPQRHVRLGGVLLPGLIEEIVGDEARRGKRRLPLLFQIEHRPVDDVDRVTAGDLGIRLDVGNEQLDRG